MSDEIVRLPVVAENQEPEIAKKAGYLQEGWTSQKEDAFCEAMVRAGNFTAGCRALGLARSTVYARVSRVPTFAAKVQEARDRICDAVEGRMYERALSTQYDPGSHVLGIFLLKSWRPEIYGERQEVRHTGPGGGPIQVQQMILELAAARQELEAGEAISYDSDKLPYQQDHLS